MEVGLPGLCGVNVQRNAEPATNTARETALILDLKMEDVVVGHNPTNHDTATSANVMVLCKIYVFV